jgi:hypothetical protein
VSCLYSSGGGGYRACKEICGEHLAIVTTLREYLVLTFSLGVTSNEFALANNSSLIYLVNPNTAWMDSIRAGHFSRGWLS